MHKSGNDFTCVLNLKRVRPTSVTLHFGPPNCYLPIPIPNPNPNPILSDSVCPQGKHAYKFIVDEEWRFDTNQPTVADTEGRINNFIDVSDFAPYTGDERFFYKSKGE